MISLNYLFEQENKKTTKLPMIEKVIGGLGVAGGSGLYALTKKLQCDDEREPITIGRKMMPPEIYNEYQDDIEHLKNIGLATAVTAGGALAAHKLYKMYKNKKNKEI